VLATRLPIAAHPQAEEFTRLVNETPALRAHAERMWTRHADTLGAAIADEFGVDHDDIACLALAQRRKDRKAALRHARQRLAAPGS
jgi:hypothetical protein